MAGVALVLTLGLSAGAAPASQVPDDSQPILPLPDPTARARRVMVEDVVRLTNIARSNEGLSPLQPNESLMQAAQDYALVLAPGPCFEHTCEPVPALRDRVARAGYGAWERIGENIAAGDRTAESVVAGWLDSPGHRANILKPEYREIGVGFTTGDGQYRYYWVQVFGTPW